MPAGKDGHLTLGKLTWDGERWRGLRCAVVAFTKKKIGAGISQGFDVFEKGGFTMFVPLIECNRFETIDRAVREFLTPSENVSEVIQPAQGKPYIRTEPAMRLPRRGPGSPVVLETLDDHLVVGSEREAAADGTLGDYADKCENHFTLANAYSALAETVGGMQRTEHVGAFKSYGPSKVGQAQAKRRERTVEG